MIQEAGTLERVRQINYDKQAAQVEEKTVTLVRKNTEKAADLSLMPARF